MVDLVSKQLEVLADIDFDVLYLGELYSWSDMPWHFSALGLLMTLPIAFVAFLLCAPAAVRAWRGRSPRKADAMWLAAIWLAVLLAADLFAPYHYDGVRHLLAVLPAVAILIAGGADWMMELLESAASRRFTATLRKALPWTIALFGLTTFVELARVHPYQTAYLNQVANAIAGPNAEEWVEVEYWGNAYKEGAEWINRYAEEGARVFFPLGGGQRSGEDIARYYLERPIVPRGTLAQFADTSRVGYLMFITRAAWYDDLIRSVRARCEPVYTIRRQRATLLEIYGNQSGCAALESPSAGRGAG
jgi:hypothetical protein